MLLLACPPQPMKPIRTSRPGRSISEAPGQRRAPPFLAFSLALSLQVTHAEAFLLRSSVLSGGCIRAIRAPERRCSPAPPPRNPARAAGPPWPTHLRGGRLIGGERPPPQRRRRPIRRGR